MRPPRRGPRNVTALSPPSDSSEETEMPQQRMRRLQNEALTAGVEAFSADHQVCHRVPLFFTNAGQARPVQEVAKDLVGYFLMCRESNVVMRIVETEAYQEREEIYRYRFREPPPDFRSPAGSLVSCTLAFNQEVMCVTAGDDDSADLVLLRTCNPVLGSDEIESRVRLIPPFTRCKRINVMAGPTNVSRALAPELKRYNYLLTQPLLSPLRGFHLRQKDPNPLIMLEGPRTLPKDTPSTRYSEMRGADSRFRFACDCDQKLLLSSSLRRI